MAERVHLIRIGYGYAITGSLPPAAIGDAYSRTLTAIGGVGTKRLEILSEDVPDAITFTDNGDNTATFAMADPQTAGTYTITVRATDSERQRWKRTFTLQVVALPLAVSGSLADATVGVAYSDSVTVSGGVQPYSLNGSSLPDGLSAELVGDTINVTGTPTGAGLGPGTAFTYAVQFQLTDSDGGAVAYDQVIGITVTAVTAAFDPASLDDAVANEAYSGDTNATGGTGGYTFTKQAGPTWLSVNSSTGALTGTPDSGDVGTGVTVTVRATDSEGNYGDVSDTIDVTDNSDPYFANVISLIHFDDSNGDTTPVDVIGKSWTAIGDAQVSTTSPLVGSGSGLFDGSGDAFETGENDDWDFLGGDWTLEISASFAALPASGGAMTFAGKWSSGHLSWWWFFFNDSGTYKLRLNWSLNGSTQSFAAVNWTPSTSTRYDLALVRSGGNLYFFVDGTQVGSTQSVSGTFNNGVNATRIGNIPIAPNYHFNGKLDEFRATKGVARYTGNYTVSLPHPDS